MKQKDLIIVLFPLFLLTILWVIFNIYHNHISSTIKDPLNFQIIPIAGNFDTVAINKIKGRQRVNPLYEVQAQVSITPIPELTEIPTPKPSQTPSTGSGQISPTVTGGKSK